MASIACKRTSLTLEQRDDDTAFVFWFTAPPGPIKVASKVEPTQKPLMKTQTEGVDLRITMYFNAYR